MKVKQIKSGPLQAEEGRASKMLEGAKEFTKKAKEEFEKDKEELNARIKEPGKGESMDLSI